MIMRISFLFLILSATYLNQGFCNILHFNTERADCCLQQAQPVVEAKAGYFFFSDSKMKKVYDNGGLDLQLCGSYRFWRCLQAYGAIEYIRSEGRSLNDHQKTMIQIIPISLGLKSVVAITSRINGYATLGPRYFFVHQHNYSSFVNNVNGNGIGGFVNAGLNYSLCGRLLLDIFGEYSYGNLNFHSSEDHVYGRNTQVGGFSFGGGLGYSF